MSPFCTKCGNEVEESWRVCPNCGKNLMESEVPQPQPQISPEPQYQTQPPAQPYQVQPYRQTYYPEKPTQYGTAALICGIIGCCCFGIVLGPIAIVLGALGMKRDQNTSMATAGLIFGIIAFVGWLISMIFLYSLIGSISPI
ncbi:MAG: DUF4190 domain-containing protein [Promethearchaeota archaeon]